MNAWDNKPNLDWCNWEVFTCCCMCRISDVDGWESNNLAVTWSSFNNFESSGVRIFVAIEATWYSFKNPPRT